MAISITTAFTTAIGKEYAYTNKKEGSVYVCKIYKKSEPKRVLVETKDRLSSKAFELAMLRLIKTGMDCFGKEFSDEFA